MRADQERVRALLTETVTLLCKNGLHFDARLRIEGVLGITIDEQDVFIVHINEALGGEHKSEQTGKAQTPLKTACAVFSSGATLSQTDGVECQSSYVSGHHDANRGTSNKTTSRRTIQHVRTRSQQSVCQTDEETRFSDKSQCENNIKDFAPANDIQQDADHIISAPTDLNQSDRSVGSNSVAIKEEELSNDCLMTFDDVDNADYSDRLNSDIKDISPCRNFAVVSRTGDRNGLRKGTNRHSSYGVVTGSEDNADVRAPEIGRVLHGGSVATINQSSISTVMRTEWDKSVHDTKNDLNDGNASYDGNTYGDQYWPVYRQQGQYESTVLDNPSITAPYAAVGRAGAARRICPHPSVELHQSASSSSLSQPADRLYRDRSLFSGTSVFSMSSRRSSSRSIQKPFICPHEGCGLRFYHRNNVSRHCTLKHGGEGVRQRHVYAPELLRREPTKLTEYNIDTNVFPKYSPE